MGWGQLPGDMRAAEEARREALERAEEADRRRAGRPMSPFESRLIGVLEEIRDHVTPGAIAFAEPVEVHELVSNGCCGGAVSLDPLLDSPPAVLARSITAGADALAKAIPALSQDYTAAGLEKFAEVVLEAALHEAARDRPKASAVQRRDGGEAGEGEPAEGPSPATP